MVLQRTENKAPFAVFGDKNGDMRNWQPETGDYFLKLTPYAQKNRQGQSGTTLSFNFHLKENKTQQNNNVAHDPAAHAQVAAGVEAVVLVEARTNKVLQTLQEGSVINLADYQNTNFNLQVKAQLPKSYNFLTIELDLKHQWHMSRWEDLSPYFAFGDREGAARNWEPETGQYHIIVKGYEHYNLPLSDFTFSIIDQPSSTAALQTENTLLLYPNPTDASVQLKLNNHSQAFTLSVYDPYGKLIYHKAGKGAATETISLSGQQPGLYMVVLEAAGERQSRRLMLE